LPYQEKGSASSHPIIRSSHKQEKQKQKAVGNVQARRNAIIRGTRMKPPFPFLAFHKKTNKTKQRMS
jgi:hypothetical protein